MEEGVHKCYKSIILLLLVFIRISAIGQNSVVITDNTKIIDLSEYLEIINTPSEIYSLKKIQHHNKWQELQNHKFVPEGNIQWVRFKLTNNTNATQNIKLSIAFSDSTDCYVIYRDSTFHQKSGDLQSFYKRPVPIGQICFVPFKIPQRTETIIYLRLKSHTNISCQFKVATINSLKVYTHEGFFEKFEKPRIFQSFFFGAVIIMWFFNLFILFSIRSFSYLYYLLYLSFLILFLSSNNGYLLELIIPNHPTIDLYIRFTATPLLMICYLLLTKNYLKTRLHTPLKNKIINYLVGAYSILLVIMLSGQWYFGRTASIYLSLISFILILIVSISIVKKGYTPARFFLAGNILLIIGAVFFALERINVIAQSTGTSYSLQIAILFEIALFSLGLADRINLVRKELSFAKFENERKEKESQIERQKLIEEKNNQLEISNKQLEAFIYRTAHDIRGPLATLMGLSTIAMKDVSDTNSLEYLDKINFTANRLNYILKRLSIVHQIYSIEVTKEDVNVNLLMKEILSELGFHEEFKNTEFKIQINENLVINTDKTLLKFIVLNLVENAIKFRDYARTYPHIVDISIIKQDQQIVINVTDNGIGINEYDKPYLFDIFTKAAVKHKTPGLGLHMVKISLNKLKGLIDVNNEINDTKFTAKIPL